MFADVVAMCWWCADNAAEIRWWCCRDDLVGMLCRCLGDVVVMLWQSVGNVSVMSFWGGMFWARFDQVLGMVWPYRGKYRAWFATHMGILQPCPGHGSSLFRACAQTCFMFSKCFRSPCFVFNIACFVQCVSFWMCFNCTCILRSLYCLQVSELSFAVFWFVMVCQLSMLNNFHIRFVFRCCSSTSIPFMFRYPRFSFIYLHVSVYT